MSPLTPIVFTVACLAIQVGWRPMPDGGTEYIIRVSPEELADLKLGDVIAASDVPADLPPIKSYRIEVGLGPVERRASPAPDAASRTPGHPDGSSPVPDRIHSPPNSDASHATIPLVFTEPVASDRAVGRVEDGSRSRESTTGDAPPPNKGVGAAATSVSPSTDETTVQTNNTSSNAEAANPVSVSNTLALSGMTASLAAALYLGWIAWEYRRKYVELLQASQPGIGLPDARDLGESLSDKLPFLPADPPPGRESPQSGAVDYTTSDGVVASENPRLSPNSPDRSSS